MLGQKTLHRSATMARFRVTDANAAAFAALRRVLHRETSLLWLHGNRRSGKSYCLSAIKRIRIEEEPHGEHLYLDGGYLVFVLARMKRQGRLRSFLDDLSRVPTLLIDDIEPLVLSAEREALLRGLLGVRNLLSRPTIITSRAHPLFLPGASLALASSAIPSETVSLSGLSQRVRRAIITDAARVLGCTIDDGSVSFLASCKPNSEEQLRRMTRRLLFSARPAREAPLLKLVRA